MERALDPQLLEGALNSHERLPTAEALAEMLEQAEIGLVRGETEVAPDLVRLGWYLHGVASAAEASQLYSLARRRHCFRVSAHIFDIALAAASEADPVEQLRLCFATQVGFYNSELSPNALAMFGGLSTFWREDSRAPALAAPLSLAWLCSGSIEDLPTRIYGASAKRLVT